MLCITLMYILHTEFYLYICKYFINDINVNNNTEPKGGTMKIANVQSNMEAQIIDSEKIKKCANRITKVAYIKTRKTGSSTIANIFYRYLISSAYKDLFEFIWERRSARNGQKSHAEVVRF